MAHLRCGLATASRFADVMAIVKTGGQLIAAATTRSLLATTDSASPSRPGLATAPYW